MTPSLLYFGIGMIAGIICYGTFRLTFFVCFIIGILAALTGYFA